MGKTKVSLSPGEWQVMEVLWRQPCTLMELVHVLGERTGWAKSTVATMIRRVEELNGGAVAAVVATGAAAPQVLAYCEHKIEYDPDLLLRGLYLIYRKNASPRQRRTP